MQRPFNFQRLPPVSGICSPSGISGNPESWTVSSQGSKNEKASDSQTYLIPAVVANQKQTGIFCTSSEPELFSEIHKICTVPSCLDIHLLNADSEDLDFLVADKKGVVSLYSRGLLLQKLDTNAQLCGSRPGSIFYFRVFVRRNEDSTMWLRQDGSLGVFCHTTSQLETVNLLEIFSEEKRADNLMVQFVQSEPRNISTPNTLVCYSSGQIVLLDAGFKKITQRQFKTAGTLIQNGLWPKDQTNTIFLFPFTPAVQKNTILAVDSTNLQPKWSVDTRHKGQSLHHAHLKGVLLFVGGLYYTRGNLLGVEVYRVSEQTAEFVDLVVLPPDIETVFCWMFRGQELLLFAKEAIFSLALKLE